MGTISRFEDIEAWKEARVLVQLVYRCCSNTALNRDFGLRDQLQRSGVSVMANIAEGFERKNPNEFKHFLRVARGSCAEVQSHLYVALDTGQIKPSQFEFLQNQAISTARKISAFQRYLNTN
ncbi:four helix bundle protein [Wenzhouxiangella sp. XN201]|uniref:four helix bundle protein n=1 Tax=Wenzhouxiangella sp. XN201 TaxID=2710755 RepID=UPI0013C8FD45|nr:four helix bundle protein [Wenzhouxiangella sp. XN201]NEZ03418.1 four helix bundle protein [Wenzhouxiangella sp. XN201]